MSLWHPISLGTPALISFPLSQLVPWTDKSQLCLRTSYYLSVELSCPAFANTGGIVYSKRKSLQTWIDLRMNRQKAPLFLCPVHDKVVVDLQESPVWWGTRRVFSPGRGSPKQQRSSWNRGTGAWLTKQADYHPGPSTPARSDTCTRTRTGSIPREHYTLWEVAGEIHVSWGNLLKHVLWNHLSVKSQTTMKHNSAMLFLWCAFMTHQHYSEVFQQSETCFWTLKLVQLLQDVLI